MKTCKYCEKEAKVAGGMCYACAKKEKQIVEILNAVKAAKAKVERQKQRWQAQS